MILLPIALLLQTGFVFSEVRAWRWSEGRGEFIPALSATLENGSGQDWAAVRFLVRVRCGSGGVRQYPVIVREVLMGRQRVEVTAYDSIGGVEFCEGVPEIVPIETTPYPSGERPAFIVLGFSARRPGQPATTSLEGILDYRNHSPTRQSVEFRPWRRHGARFELPEAPDTAFYMIRVPPGRIGLAGFVLEPSQEPTSPLSRFLRFYDVPPGQAGWVGVFHLEVEGAGRASLTLEAAPELLPQLAPHVPRPLIEARPAAPPPGSTLVAGP